MTRRHLINCIYRATEGEGIFLGRPQIFVRYQGCNVGCVNCDSKETWSFKEGNSLTLSEVLEAVIREGHGGKIKNVSITGGDPLHPAHAESVIELIEALKSLNYYVNIEAAGTRVVPGIFDLVDYISFDIKTPSTYVKTPLEGVIRLHREYPNKFQIKAVVSDKIDFDYVLNAYYFVLKEIKVLCPPWVITPAYNDADQNFTERFKEILAWNELEGGHFRVIGQQHKWIYGPDQKEV